MLFYSLYFYYFILIFLASLSLKHICYHGNDGIREAAGTGHYLCL